MDEKLRNLQEAKQTIGQFLYECLKNEGITEIFGVPGDYNFSLLDILEKYKDIRFVNCRNELNAGYAADAYARIKGISAIITTFGVGELSACNAIAGSYCESVPVIHIVGGPKTKDQQEHKQVHHTLLNGDFNVFKKIYSNITEYATTITVENAIIEIPKAIEKAKQTKKTVYLLISTDIVSQPIMKKALSIEQIQTNPNSLKSALEHIVDAVKKAQRPILISGVYVSRYNLEQLVQQLVEKINLPVTTMMMGKGSFDESHVNYIGLYDGDLGSNGVQNIVESSDCVLAVGTVWSDNNTGLFTAKLNPLDIIEIQPFSVKVGMALYENILMKDLLRGLLQSIERKLDYVPTVPSPYDSNFSPSDEAISSKYYYPRFQNMLKENDVIIADSGTFQLGIAEMRLPKGATYITQGGWGSIGYGTPAAFGACIADKNRRVILFTGDGSNQMTVQELSSMLYNHCKPIIFLLNNQEYTIEKYLNVEQKQTHYNDIPLWNYSKLIEAFGGTYFTAKVHTSKELDDAIKHAEAQYIEKLCFIEICAPKMDAPPMVHRMTAVLEQMKE
jgi:indolepyruvate decarboxylase